MLPAEQTARYSTSVQPLNSRFEHETASDIRCNFFRKSIRSLRKEFVEIWQQLGKKTGQKFAYSAQYLSDYWVDLYCTFSIGSRVCENYKTSTSFALAQNTLLW